MLRYFENLVDPYEDYVEKDVPQQRILPFLTELAWPFRKIFAATAALKMISAVMDVLLFWYLGRMVDLLAQGVPGEVWRLHGTEFIVVGLAILILRPIIGGCDVALLHNTINTNFGTLIRWRSYRHVLRQPVGWFESDFAGRISNRIMQMPASANEAVFQTFDAIAFAVSTLIATTALFANADMRLLPPLIIWTLAYFWLLRWTTSRAGPAAQAASDARSMVTGRVVDSYSNIHSVKLFSHHGRESAYVTDAIETHRQKAMVEMRIITKMDVTLTAMNGLLIVAVSGLALKFWYDGEASVGLVAAATAMVLRLNSMTYWIMWATTQLVQSLGVVAEGMETIAQPVQLIDAPDAKPLQFRGGRIELQGVSHHYGRGTGGLDRVNLTIAPGEKLGLIGRSGAGKSTLVKLLLRFYDVEGGRILIDGQDISLVTQDSLRAQIGVVQQETSLMHRSVRDNILYGRPDATEAEMIAAAKRAEADEFIHQLRDPNGSEGYDAQVGERGVKLSGGQRQRVALARVILKDAPILVLDEATSALDSEVEAAIQDTLYGVMEGKTVIAIAHRLSTIARLDRIVVIDDGRIVEEGTHTELLAKAGLYARLWSRQSGGFIGADTDETEDAAQ